MKKMFQKPVLILIIFAFIALMTFFIVEELSFFESKSIIINSDLAQDNKEIVEKFVSTALKEEFLPKEINLQLMPTNATLSASMIKEYFASWEAGEEVFSLLYVIKDSEKKPDFIRLWALNFDENISKEKSEALLNSYFKESYVEIFRELECAKIEGVDLGTQVTECGDISQQKPADLIGLTVRGPVPVSQSFSGQIISACLVPDGVLRGYPFKNCI